MALRTKTIEYAFPLHITSLASATARNWDAAGTNNITVYIPETSSRTFRSVSAEFSFCDATTATGASTTAILTGIKVGAAAISEATVTMTLTNSGENYTVIASKDVTAYFQTNFSGTSQVCEARLTVTGIITINATCKLIITYEYEDSAATTRIKTVKIPIDGHNGALTTSFANIGGVANQWPALDTFLPEASKVYRDIFFQMDIHTGTTAAAAAVLNMRYDGSTTVADGSWGHSLASDTSYRRIDKLLSLATNVTHSIEANTTSTTGKPCNCISGVIVVTYEYNHSTSTTIMNSIQFSTMDEAGWCGGTATGDKGRFQREVSVQEPGTITLVQSGILCAFIDAGVITLDLRLGGQASRTFAHPATVRDGCVTSMRRLDSGAVGGAGMTLVRGYNTLTVDWFTTSATAGNIGANMSGLVYLNYKSDKHASGDGVHAHTTAWLILPYETGGLVQRKQKVPAIVPNIPETDYWLGGASYQVLMMTSGTSSANLAFAIQTEVQSTEAEGAGWRSLYSALYASDAEMGQSIMWCRARTEFKRWPNDTDSSRLNIETARDYRCDINLNSGAVFQLMMLMTYHSITYTIAGNIVGSSGGTVNITAYRADTGEKIGSTSRAGNGSYSITWYDNTANVIVEARESSTLIGRSDDGVAT